jgi:hypothetical protein
MRPFTRNSALQRHLQSSLRSGYAEWRPVSCGILAAVGTSRHLSLGQTPALAVWSIIRFGL